MSGTEEATWPYRDCDTSDLLQAARNVLYRWGAGLAVQTGFDEDVIRRDIGVLAGAIRQEEQRRLEDAAAIVEAAQIDRTHAEAQAETEVAP